MEINTSRLLAAAGRSVAAGDQEIEDVDGIDMVRLLFAAGRTSGIGAVSRPKKRDVGAFRAFGAGIEKGIKEPFRLLGIESREVELDETSEQVANFLGSLVGLGISFVPFAFGTGILLRGLGLTAKIAGAAGVTSREAARSQALFNFVRNTAAGATQFAGTSEELSQVPGRAAVGAAFGGAIEGVFLARAMRGRRGAVSKASLLDDGNPVADVPVDIDRMVTEIEISPSVNKTAERMTLELDATFTQNKNWEQVITDLLETHVETARFTGLSNKGANDILDYAKTNFPSAQRLVRGTRTTGVREVLIHQPFDPSDSLTPGQIAQWKATGFAKGEQVFFRGDTWEVTGAAAAEGRVQIKSPFSNRVVFSADIDEVTRSTTGAFFRESRVRAAGLRAAVESLGDRIGFVVPASTVSRGASLSARRGFVDVSEFETAGSFREFAEQFVDDLAGVQAASPEEAVGIIAAERGIPGLRILDDGVTTRVHVFDQKKVSFISEPPVLAKSVSEVRPIGDILESGPVALALEKGRTVTLEGSSRIAQPTPAAAAQIAAREAVPGAPREIPNLGLVLDDAVFSTTLAGEPVLSSFVPSWKNSISAPLREAGIPEKEIAKYLDLYAINQTRRLDSLMEPEFQAIKNASTIQFGGCP